MTQVIISEQLLEKGNSLWIEVESKDISSIVLREKLKLTLHFPWRFLFIGSLPFRQHSDVTQIEDVGILASLCFPGVTVPPQSRCHARKDC